MFLNVVIILCFYIFTSQYYANTLTSPTLDHCRCLLLNNILLLSFACRDYQHKFIMHSLSSIKVLSANYQGLRSNDKRTDVVSFLKETKASIVCLQDTHLTNKDLRSAKRIWHECYLHGNKTNSRGVAILLNKNFEYHVHETSKDMEGNYIQLI